MKYDEYFTEKFYSAYQKKFPECEDGDKSESI